MLTIVFLFMFIHFFFWCCRQAKSTLKLFYNNKKQLYYRLQCNDYTTFFSLLSLTLAKVSRHKYTTHGSFHRHEFCFIHKKVGSKGSLL